MIQSQCFNSSCLQLNPLDEERCQLCGAPLLLCSRYRAIRLISKKQFSLTFLAVDTQETVFKNCIIKQFTFQGIGSNNLQQASKILNKKGEILKKLNNHLQIPQLLDYFIEREKSYLIYEFIEGQSLTAALPGNNVLNQQQLSKILVNLLIILQFIHNHKIIHGDINPENIFLRKDNNKIILIGFGLGNFTSSILSIEPEPYIAPEQKKGQAVYASDLYSLGVTCLYLLTKVNPVKLFDANKMSWSWRNYLVINPISESLSIIIDKLIEIDLKQRFNSVEEVLFELNKIGIKAKKQQKNTAILSSNETELTSSFTKRIKNFLFTEIKPSLSMPVFVSKIKSNVSNNSEDIFDNLEFFLAEKKWKEADQETWRLMTILAKKEEENILISDDMLDFPCQDLMIIDQLWIGYSKGRFGFTTQKNIYKNLGGTEIFNIKIWQDFGEKVGWREKKDWINYFDLKFEITAPQGHLPVEPVKVNLDRDSSVFIKRGMLLISIFYRLMFCQQ